ncbi:MAG TPA: hypothetical protein PKV88_04495 [Bacteroidales bacterium]|jgi:hypothetical protein|nr:hypothetical protein [Bacteroidales bacterium]MDY0086661.1 hypothetical protein [Bacteroidales bacterium]HPE43320.1 hypothetical protein [Bacteroidales bacterium]
MNVAEKRAFIHNFLLKADESTINEFYEKLKMEQQLKQKLEKRALKSEKDIANGNVFERAEVISKTL